MTTHTTRTVDDRVGGIQRQIRALWKTPQDWDATDLYLLARLEQDVDVLRSSVVRALRDSGVTDGQIAQEMNITRQAVSKRWPGGGRFVGAAGRYRTPRDDADDAA